MNNLHFIRATMTAARIAWDPPDLSVCNAFKGYQVYLSKVNVTFVYQRSHSNI